MKTSGRKSALEIIRANIASHGHHIYVVSGGPLPRFAYTIGLREVIRTELVLAGASFYSVDEVTQIINRVAADLRTRADSASDVEVDLLGRFSLQKADASWANALLLGALDFYKTKNVEALQIVPDREHWTLDVPALNQVWSASAQPVWKWLYESWSYPIAPKSTAVTNLAALRGERITEAVRWEDEEWELFAGAGPDVAEEDIRLIPIATLLAADPSLSAVVDLRIGDALWRESTELQWHVWKRTQQP